MASHVIEVEFKGNRREFFLWESDDIPTVNSAVIVEADRGEDLGRVHAVGAFALKRNRGVPHGTGEGLPGKRARRVASSDDVRKHDDLRAQDEEARRKAMERVRANALVMKVSDAEWQWDRKKLTFYFTAEKRVDFRTLVRELAATFRTRIELKQIGVRDEAKRLDGVGRCGRQYCSAAWLPELRPVSLGVAKDQRLSLNPTQISGACGRLMCSLRYEHEFYVQSRKRFPKEGKTIRTGAGEERVVSNDIFRERVTLRSSEGETRTIPLAQFQQETGAAVASAGGLAGSGAVPEQTEDPAPTGGTPVTSDGVAADDELLEEEPEEDRLVVEAVADEPEALGGASSAAESARASRDQPAGDRPAGDRPAGDLPASHRPAGDRPADDHPARERAPGEPADRRPHRRRGRRGGRRNRGGGRDRGSDGTGGPAQSPPSSGGPA